MTKQDYETFKKNFNSFFECENVELMASAAPESEPFFSWQACDCCGSNLGGNRETYVAIEKVGIPNPRKFEIEICSDCVYFNEYGQLDDQTMLDMEKESEIHA